jgi:hypothetical protein
LKQGKPDERCRNAAADDDDVDGDDDDGDDGDDDDDEGDDERLWEI